MPPTAILLALGLAGAALLGGLPPSPGDLVPAARPNPYNIGNCFQYKGCLGESIGNMWFWDPAFCKPVGGKSWKNAEGKCFDLPDGPQPVNPRDFVHGGPVPAQGCPPAPGPGPAGPQRP
jgi:hypothetical protein